MAYSVPANPEWDLQGLLDKVPDLAKKAIAGPKRSQLPKLELAF